MPYYRSSDAFLSHFYAAKVPTSFTFATFTTKLFFKNEDKLAQLQSTVRVFSIVIEVWVPYNTSSDHFLSHFYSAKLTPFTHLFQFQNKTL